MDLEKQYIKMCEKAVEIQKLWEPFLGDLCMHPIGEWGDTCGIVLNKIKSNSDKIYIYRGTASVFNNTFTYDNYETFTKNSCIWIPHQNQLQKIAKKEGESLESLVSSFWYWIQGPDHQVSIPTKSVQKSWEDWNNYICVFKSMEELWLAYIMDILFDKIWVGRKWSNDT